MYRFLRDQDRELNKDSYPRLVYPEIYVLEGGYKAFFEKHEVRYNFHFFATNNLERWTSSCENAKSLKNFHCTCTAIPLGFMSVVWSELTYTVLLYN